jgi:hypothetical protein
MTVVSRVGVPGKMLKNFTWRYIAFFVIALLIVSYLMVLGGHRRRPDAVRRLGPRDRHADGPAQLNLARWNCVACTTLVWFLRWNRNCNSAGARITHRLSRGAAVSDPPSALQNRETAFGRSFCSVVPELTRRSDIKLNKRVSLPVQRKILSSSKSCRIECCHAYRTIRGSSPLF